jgi:hypothetical protein
MLAMVAACLVAASGTAQAQSLVNGDWETADETGWSQVTSTWGGGFTWTVGPPGNAPTPDNAGHLTLDSGSFGWYQVVEVPTSWDVTVDADWMGNDISWCEVMLFTFDHDPSYADVYGVFDTGPVDAIAYKKDRFGMNPLTTWTWEAASLSPHPQGNGGTITSEGWIVVGLKLGANAGTDVSAAWDNIVITVDPGPCLTQHTTTMINPDSTPSDSNVTITITGTNLEQVNTVDGVKLVSVLDATEIVGTNVQVGPGPNETTLTADFATAGAYVGFYHVVTEQPIPCASRQLTSAFEVTCANPSVVSSITPDTVTDPAFSSTLTLAGQNLGELDPISLELGNLASVVGLNPTPNGDDLDVTFDMSCTPSGRYRLTGSRDDGCSDLEPASAGDDVLELSRTRTSPCPWQPWSASWSDLNVVPVFDPPDGEHFNPTNWDYSFSQTTLLGMSLDTPDASDRAFHWLIGIQPPDFTADPAGSGGIFQEITVTPGTPLKYSFWWKAEIDQADAWFEFILINGPFSVWETDAYQESQQGQNNPSIVRKRVLPDDLQNLGFEWTQVTDEDTADPGPYGDRPTTITPTGDVVTVVLKAGRYPVGNVEVLFDNVEVWQGTGSNLVVNGDFEDGSELWACENPALHQDDCEASFWLESDVQIPPPCPDPFADTDDDGDVDQDDFAVLQACFTGDLGPFELPEECLCFDRPGPPNGDDDVDQGDLAAFEVCALTSGPGVPADPACDD